MMLKKYIILQLLFLLLLTSLLSGFDGKRKGFVLGGGVGFFPSFSWSLADTTMKNGLKTSDDNKGIGGIQLMIGYAWNEQNMLVYEGEGSSIYSEFFDEYIRFGCSGLSWYHYFSNNPKSFLSIISLGSHGLRVKGREINKSKPGVMFGGGYQFTPHFQVAIRYAIGRSSYDNLDYKHSQLSIMVNGIFY